MKHIIDVINENNVDKQKQLNIILKYNPVDDKNIPGHTWIRNIKDILTYEEALKEFGWFEEEQNITPDFKIQDIKNALKYNKITVYSSYEIKQGVFVTPSKMEAQNYAGTNKIYSKEVKLNDVAWIDTIQGQYAKI